MEQLTLDFYTTLYSQTGVDSLYCSSTVGNYRLLLPTFATDDLLVGKTHIFERLVQGPGRHGLRQVPET
jgi:hypothetical protein